MVSSLGCVLRGSTWEFRVCVCVCARFFSGGIPVGFTSAEGWGCRVGGTLHGHGFRVWDWRGGGGLL